jgi:CRISPR-associated protein Cmr6
VEVELLSRLLVGHGTQSPTEVGLTTHRTWGVPVVPGTALKGLLSHYVDAVYGPRDPKLHP